MRNDKLNANSFFNNASGSFGPNDTQVRLGLNTAGEERVPRPKLRYNNFGYLVSGPVMIPGLYNEDRDKTFFLFSQEFRRIIRAPSKSRRSLCRACWSGRETSQKQATQPIFDPYNRTTVYEQHDS